jgi:hypothetical protein
MSKAVKPTFLSERKKEILYQEAYQDNYKTQTLKLFNRKANGGHSVTRLPCVFLGLKVIQECGLARVV